MANLTRVKDGTLLHPRENLVIAGNLAALNAEVIVDTDGCNSVAIDLRGVFNLTVELSGTIDNVQWIPMPVRPVNQPLVRYVAAIPGAVPGVWAGAFGAPYIRVRARVTAYTSGSAAAALMGSTALLDNTLQSMVTTDILSATSAVGVATTLTIPAPGVGLRQYLTYLRASRFATAVMTAGAAPVLVTSTNLPGTPAFAMPATAAPQGDLATYQEAFSYPLAAAAQNTAVVFTFPATPLAIPRITAGWYVAP